MEATIQRPAKSSAATKSAPPAKLPSAKKTRVHVAQVLGNLETADAVAQRHCAYINHMAENIRKCLRAPASEAQLIVADQLADMIAANAINLADAIGSYAEEVSLPREANKEFWAAGVAEADKFIAGLRVDEAHTAPKQADRAPPSRRSALPPDSIDFVFERLRQSRAIATVVSTAFGGDYSKDDRPSDDTIMMSLERVGMLLTEALRHLDNRPLGDKPLCETDPWWSDLRDAAALTETITTLAWADGWEITFSDDLLGSYLWAVTSTIERAIAGLEGVIDSYATDQATTQ